MKLIGMMDSPYVRRVAVSAQLLGLALEHEPISVFRHYARFAAINPVVKAPTLVCDDASVLLDSSLILDYLEALVAPAQRLNPQALPARQQALRRQGLALAAMEKTVQAYYETQLRPAAKQHAEWLTRVCGQLQQAYALLELEAQGLSAAGQPFFGGATPDAADVATAVAWRFTALVRAQDIDAAQHPALLAHSLRCEALPAFAACPPQ